MHLPIRLVLALGLAVAMLSPAPAFAQQPTGDPDRVISPLQPDFTLVNLSTTLRLPRFASAFRVTHRFWRPLAEGDVGDLLGDAFGLDSSATTGLEYRFGLMRGLQVGVHRTSSKTITFFGQYSLMQEGDARLIGLGVIASMDGTNNFRDSYSPAIGVVLSRSIGRLGVVYVEPIWVNNSNPLPKDLVRDNDTILTGLGVRLKVLQTVYLVGEIVPRVAGYAPSITHASFALEKRAGRHMFQLNVSNGVATTMSDLGRGGTDNDAWYLGFNLSRKFF